MTASCCLRSLFTQLWHYRFELIEVDDDRPPRMKTRFGTNSKKVVFLSPYTNVPKNLLESGEQYIVVSRFSSAFSGCLTRGVINAARIVLFKFYN